MIAFSSEWERWAKISIIKHFQAISGLAAIQFFVEGFERDTEAQQEYIEIRIDGPNIKEFTKNCWRLFFEVNILIAVQENNENAYRGSELTGRVSSLFNECIMVKKYGTGAGDDQTHLSTLIRVNIGNEKIQVSHFGKIQPNTRLIMATVEGHYDMFLD